VRGPSNGVLHLTLVKGTQLCMNFASNKLGEVRGPSTSRMKIPIIRVFVIAHPVNALGGLSHNL